MADTKSYININGDVRDASSLTMPASGREFRAAWQFDGDTIDIDMVKARDMVRDRIRSERGPEFEKLDVQFFRAMEEGGATEPIAQRKQKLRDAPNHPKIDEATTPEELSAINLKDLV